MIDYENLRFASDKPYPPLKVTQENCTYAKWILDNVGGSNSEISAVSLYFYNNLMIDESYTQVARIFHKISVVEMHHLNIFGKLALLLGEDPRLWTMNCNRKCYWTPGYNRYPLEFDSLLNNALTGELATIEKYKEQICRIDDPYITENLKRIILDEELHVDLFKMILREYCS